MAEKSEFSPKHTAVMCMDYQNAIVSAYGGSGVEELLTRSARVLEQARKIGMLVIYVRVGFRPGLPEISPRNTLFSAVKNSPERQKMFLGAGREIHAAVAPQENEIIIEKHRVGAFTGTDLDMILRANEIDTLVLFGIATSGVVLSTLVDAFDADYKIVVIKDCCADRDEDLHSCLTEKYFTTRGTVITAEEFAN